MNTAHGMQVLHDGPGRLRRITVLQTEWTRYLELDGCEEGAMSRRSEEPVFHYLWFHRCSVLSARRPAHVLVLGAGAFTAAKCLALDYPEANIDAVDAEPELEPIARRFFGLERAEFGRIRFHGVPADEFLASTDLRYDFVFDDMFDGFQHVPIQSRTREHFQQVRQVLAEGAVFVKNVIYNPLTADTRAACAEACAALRESFPHHAVLGLGEPHLGHNQILVGLLHAPEFAWAEIGEHLQLAGIPRDITRLIRIEQIAPL